MSGHQFQYELFLKIQKGDINDVKKALQDQPHLINHPINNYGWSPLNVAAYYGHIDLCQHLLENGAIKNYFNNSGFNSVMLASRKGFEGVAQYIKGFDSREQYRGKSAIQGELTIKPIEL